MTNNKSGNVQIIGMIGVTQETPENAGASLSVFGGGINPGGDVPAGVDPDYIVDFAVSHERAGFDMVLTGYSSTTPDGFEIAGYAAAHTSTLGYLIAHRPGFVSPTLAARKIATLDQLTRGRVALHIISGGSDAEQQQDGDWLDHDSRYRRTDEYMTVLKNMWLKNEASDFEGEFYSYKGAHCKVTCYQKPHVPLFFGGASEIAARIGSRQADYYAFLGEPLGVITDRVNVLKEQAKQCFQNIESIVTCSGGSLDDIVKITSFMVNSQDYADYAEVRQNLFPNDGPASSTVFINGLVDNRFLIEIEAVANID